MLDHHPSSDYPSAFAPAVRQALEESLRLDDLAAGVRARLDRLRQDGALGGVSRVVLTGSGDSLFAALSVTPALRRWTGRAVETLTSLELARYESPLLGPGDLVVAVSNSGSSTRTRETAILAGDARVPTLAVVGSADGPLAALARHVLPRPVAPLPDLPQRWGRCLLNMSEYLATQHALFELGLALAGHRLDRAAAERWRSAIACAVAANAEAADALEPRIRALAETLVDAEMLWMIGCGPSQGTARYAAAKCHEQLPIAGVAQDLEEWAHLEYFLTLEIGRRSVVVVHAPPGNAIDRARELVAGIGGAGGRAIVVTAEDDGSFAGAEAVLAVGGGHPELVTPLLYHLPAQLLVLHMARLRNRPRIPLRRQDGYALIRGGSLRETRRGLG